MIWDWDLKTGVTTWNDAIYRTLGYRPGQVGKDVSWWKARIHPDDRERILKGTDAVLQDSNKTWRTEYRFQRGDGSYATVLDRGFVVRDDQGRPIRMVGSMIDLTARREAEKERERLLAEIANERARLGTVIKNIPVGVALAEAPSGRIVLTNPALAQILRQPPIPTPDVQAYSRWNGYHPDGRRYEAEEWPLAQALLYGEQIRGREAQYRRGDGTMTWIRIDAAPIRDSNGKIIGAVSDFIDISTEKRIEEEQRFLSETTAILGSSLDLESMLHDLARRVTATWADIFIADLANPTTGEFQRVLTMHRDPAQAHVMELLKLQMPSRTLPLFREAFESGRAILIEKVDDDWLRAFATSEEHFELLRALHPTSILFIPLISRGRAFGLITSARTEPGNPYTEEDRAMAEELAHRIGLAIRECASLQRRGRRESCEIGFPRRHESRTAHPPQRDHRLRRDLLLAGVPKQIPDEDRNAVHRIIASAQHLRELIDEILSYSRMETGQELVSAEMVNLGTLVREAAKTAEREAREKGLDFSIEVPEGWAGPDGSGQAASDPP